VRPSKRCISVHQKQTRILSDEFSTLGQLYVSERVVPNGDVPISTRASAEFKRARATQVSSHVAPYIVENVVPSLVCGEGMPPLSSVSNPIVPAVLLVHKYLLLIGHFSTIVS